MMPVRGQAPTSNHSDMAYDRPSGLIVLWDHGCARMVMGFQGGCDAQVNRTWTWNGDAWTATPARSSPIAMGQGGMVFDARLAKVVYVNGAGQVWSWTASGWNSVPVRGAPGVGAAGQTLAVGYDERRGLVVLVRADSTWLWDGDAWTVRSGGIGVANRHAAGQLAYDAARAQLVFVGEGATWTWDGALWQRHDQAGIIGGALGYDAARSTLVLVQQDSSACDHTACSTTTWVWAQSLWSRLDTAPGPVLPVTRSGAFAIPTAFDEARGVLVLFASAT